MNNIYLVGFMGTGKTHIGKELAKKKKWRFIDLDDLIEFRGKRSIRDMFAQDGEAYFRRAERAALKEVAGEDKFVVACGGGVVLDPENIKVMKNTGLVVCLSASVETILKRTAGVTHRPLLNVANPKKQIELLLKMRTPYYAQADKAIDTTKLTPRQVVDRILKIKRKRK